jgi:hypothetical protein
MDWGPPPPPRTKAAHPTISLACAAKAAVGRAARLSQGLGDYFWARGDASSGKLIQPRVDTVRSASVVPQSPADRCAEWSVIWVV